jgi:lysophospholipase L1-like esterase
VAYDLPVPSCRSRSVVGLRAPFARAFAALILVATAAGLSTPAGAAPASASPNSAGAAPRVDAADVGDPALVIVGDSVILGAKNTIQSRFAADWDVTFDAAVSRTTTRGAEILEGLDATIENHVIISLGYNDGWATEPFRTRAIRALDAVADVDHVYWITLRDPDSCCDYVQANAVIRALAAERNNVEVLDWQTISLNDDAATWDGLHLTGHGATLMTDMIQAGLAGTVDPTSICTTPINPTPTPNPASARGYWMLDNRGAVHPYGAATNLGDLLTDGVGAFPQSMQSTPSGNGYWIVDEAGEVHAYGDAAFKGDMTGKPLNGPVRRIESHPGGDGYWLVASDGGVFTFGDAAYHGSTGATPLNQPVISMSSTASGSGYWLVASDGGVFTFGDAAYLGSTGAITLNRPVIDMTVHPSGGGYWLYASDGGVFTFGNATYLGSVPGMGLCSTPNTVAMRASADGIGYWVVTEAGWVIGFGTAADHGGNPTLGAGVDIIDFAVMN